MRSSDTIKPTCETCGATVKPEEAEKHFHALNLINEDPLTYVVLLPGGLKFGGTDAAEAFARTLGELKKKHPDRAFHLMPYGFYQVSEQKQEKNGTVTYIFHYLESILAVSP